MHTQQTLSATPDAPRETLNHKVVEALYSEALMLADEARDVFHGSNENNAIDLKSAADMALSVEALRTTTRIMHMLAWLLNQRAFFAGELSAKQLDAFGLLPSDRAPDPEQLALLNFPTRELISRSEQMHAQISRLETNRLRGTAANDQGSIGDLHGKLAAAFQI